MANHANKNPNSGWADMPRSNIILAGLPHGSYKERQGFHGFQISKGHPGPIRSDEINDRTIDIKCSTINASAASFARWGRKVNWAASGCNQARSAATRKTAKAVGHDRPHSWTSCTNSPTSNQARCRYATQSGRYPARPLLTLTRARMRAASSLI